MTILVTSATGMVGRHVVTALVRTGHRVRAPTRTPTASSLPRTTQQRLPRQPRT
ncbi:NmrA family NAD(P)-binding protein [Micromonospora sp. DT53]|uniref:NmrA family NAD(P)-binding protein n=1 Tax=Micromonospora sp. DT53 TaxID=3393444 RepID=UPI003CF15F95